MRRYIYLPFLFLVMMASAAFADSPLQISLFNPWQLIAEEDSVRGLRANFLYGVNDKMYGLDLGFVNKTTSYQKGFQIGIINSTFDFSGFQVGVINKTQWLRGVQVGLINISSNEERTWVPVFNFNF